MKFYKSKKPKNTLRNVFGSILAGTETTNSSSKPLPVAPFGFLVGCVAVRVEKQVEL